MLHCMLELPVASASTEQAGPDVCPTIDRKCYSEEKSSVAQRSLCHNSSLRTYRDAITSA